MIFPEKIKMMTSVIKKILGYRILTSVLILLAFGSVQAGTAMWVLTPLTPTSLIVPSNGTATVKYRVTNLSRAVHILTVKSIPGITQVTSSGNCPVYSSLGYKNSCILNLLIDGKKLTKNITDGPVVCEKRNSSQCYRPATGSNLKIIKGPTYYTVGGTVRGLQGSLALLGNGEKLLTVNSNGSFTFSQSVQAGKNYSVDIQNAPPSQTCTITNKTGTNISRNVTNVNVLCATKNYVIGGGLSGLNASGLVLQNNGSGNLSVNSGATFFEFPTAVAYGGNYNVTVLQQPTGLTCTVSNGSGSNLTANKNNVSVNCSAQSFSVGGSLSGLNASSLVLQNNGGDDLTVSSGASTFQFSTPVAYGGSYNITVLQQPTGLVCSVSNGSGSNVIADATGASITCNAQSFAIGGGVTGLNATGLVLQNNGGDDLTVTSGATSLQFTTPIAYGGNYNVTVLQQPTGETCTVSHGSGINVLNDVSNISITCNAQSFSVGGSLSGLNASGLVLQNNGGDDLTVSSGASTFQFSTPVAYGGSYNITVLQQPTGLTCSVSNGSGSNVIADATGASITCNAQSFAIGGGVTGLNATGLVLQNNGGDDLSVSSGATSFQFSTPVAYGGSYNVTVLQQPTGLTCSVSNGSGSSVSASVASINIICNIQSFTISGSVSGLNATGLVLQNNGGDDLTVASGATSLQFPTAVAYGGNYNVTVLQQPGGLICTINNDSGVGLENDVNNILVTCSTQTFTIQGSISGLNASGLILQNNGGNSLSVNSGATSLQFSTPVPYGGNYAVTVLQQPTGLVCTVNNGSGTNIMSDVSNVSVTCDIQTYVIGGTVSNLNSSGLRLQNNSGDTLTITSGATSFQFATPVSHGGGYNVTVLQHPTGLVCSVSNESGANVTADVNTVSITCNEESYVIGGTVSNLSASGLVLRNNGGDDLAVSSGATSFQFSTPVAYNGNYNITVSQQPTGMSCSVSNGSGSNITGDISNVTINCGIVAAYVTNMGSTNTVFKCSVNTSNGLITCSGATGSGYNNPTDIKVNPLGTAAYVTNWGNSTILLCSINQSTGALTCATTGGTCSGASGISINSTNTFAYVSCRDANTIYRCAINQSTLALTCASTGSGFDLPVHPYLNPAGTIAYVANSRAGTNTVTLCNINATTGALTCPRTTGSGFTQPYSVTLNPAGTFAYVTNYSANTVSLCSVDQSTGDLTCSGTTGSGFTKPTNITFNQSGTLAYVTNFISGASISLCSVNQTTGALTCSSYTGNTLKDVQKVDFLRY